MGIFTKKLFYPTDVCSKLLAGHADCFQACMLGSPENAPLRKAKCTLATDTPTHPLARFGPMKPPPPML